jgi:hypothetical protein
MTATIETGKLESFFTTPPSELPAVCPLEYLPSALGEYLALTDPLGADRLKQDWHAINPAQNPETEIPGERRAIIFSTIFSDSSIHAGSPRATRALELLLPYLLLPPRSDTLFASAADIKKLTPSNTLTLGAVLAEALKLKNTKLGERMPYWALSYVLTHAAIENKLCEQNPELWTDVVATMFKYLPEQQDDMHPIFAPMFEKNNPHIQTLTRDTLKYIALNEHSILRNTAIRRMRLLEPSEASAVATVDILEYLNRKLNRPAEFEAIAYYYDIALSAETAALVCPSKARPLTEKHLAALGNIIGTMPISLNRTNLEKRLHTSLGALYEYASDDVLKEHIASLSRENPSYLLQNLEHLIAHVPEVLVMTGDEDNAPLWIPLVEEYIRKVENFPRVIAQQLSRACYPDKENNYAYDLIRYASKPARGVLRQYVNQHIYSDAVTRFTRESSNDVDGFIKKVYQHSAKNFINDFFKNPMALRYLSDGIEYGMTDTLILNRFETARRAQIDALWEKASENVLLLDALDRHLIDASRVSIAQARTLLTNASNYRVDFPRNISASLPHLEAKFVHLALHNLTYTNPYQDIMKLYSLEHRRILNAPSSLALILVDLVDRYNAHAVATRRDDEFMNALITDWMRYVRIRGAHNVIKDIRQLVVSSGSDVPWYGMVLRLIDSDSPIYKRLSSIKPYSFSPLPRESGDDAAAYLNAIVEDLRSNALEAKAKDDHAALMGPT